MAPPLLVFGFALAMRLALVITGRDFALFQYLQLDMAYHDQWARKIVGGELWGDQAFFRAPLYPYFLAFLYWVGDNSILFARCVQAAVGAFSPVLLYYLGLDVFRSRRVALAGALLLATLWTAVYFDIELLLVVLEISLDLVALLFLVKARDGRVRNFALAGLFLGLSAITRPNILACAAFIWAIYVFDVPRMGRNKIISGLAVCYLSMAAVILPVTVRNYVVGQDTVLISSQGGVNFYIGNNPWSDGVTAMVPGARSDWWGGFYGSKLIAEEAEGRALKPSEVSHYYLRKSLEFIKEEPVKALRLMIWKAHLYTNAYETGNNYENNFLRSQIPLLKYDPVSLYAVLPFALLGMALHVRKWRKYCALYLFVVIYSTTVVLFFVNDKFRMPVVPILCLFAAAGFFRLWEQFRSRRLKSFGIGLGALILLVLYTGLTPGQLSGTPIDVEVMMANARVSSGAMYLHLGRYEEAERELAGVLEQYPNHTHALNVLGTLYYQTGRKEDGAEVFKRALAAAPNNVVALNSLGVYYTDKRDFKHAYEMLNRSLAARRADAETHYLLGDAYFRDGAYDKAVTSLRMAISFQDNYAPAYELLGLLMLKAGDIAEAEEVYARLLKLDSKSPLAMEGLAEVYYRKGEHARAEELFKRLIDVFPGRADLHHKLARSLASQGKTEEARAVLAKARQVKRERMNRSAWLRRRPGVSAQ